MTAKKTVDKVEVVKSDTTESVKEEQVQPSTVKFSVTLANGNEVELEAVADTMDLDFELLEHAQRGNYAVFLSGALTPKSNFLLKAQGAKLRDFETISDAYGRATGDIIEGE